VKNITKKQSRNNIKNRKNKVLRRHNKAGRWSARPEPMFSRGKLHYEVGSKTEAMSFGGIGAVHRMVTKLGLCDA